jgi:hypothetical protein
MVENKQKITFILASSNMGNIMKTGSTGVDKYSRPSVEEQN